MFRNYDWECTVCHAMREHIVQFPQGDKPPQFETIACEECERETWHQRLISLPAEYHGERVFNPVVRGGSFDTAGFKALPSLPDLPAGVPETAGNYREIWRTPEYREIKRERNAIKAENAAKQKRLKLLRKGENINMRRDKLPGDPKLTA